MTARPWPALLAAATLLAPAPVRAQNARPEVVASLSSRQVEVGESFTVELKAMSDQGESTSDPQLRPPTGFEISGPRISTQTVAQFGGGKSTVKSGLGATWTLVASAPGTYTIPAPSVLWAGQRVAASPMPIEVVPATGRSRSNPFLLPGGPTLGWPFGPSPRPSVDPLEDPDTPAEGELSLPTAPDDRIFLRIGLDKEKAVVGEQVTASFYIYARYDFEAQERHDAPLADFLRVPLSQNPGTGPVAYAIAGGHKFTVRLLDRVALFPLRAGELSTGSFSARFTGRHLGRRVLRESNDPTILVADPPSNGRPPGYVTGNVGNFSLEAAVQPKRIRQGESLSVTVKVSGSGNLPQRLRVPERTGVEWLDPETRQATEAPGGVVGGWRSFGYVVRIEESGTVDLGKIELPFWDPAANAYRTAVAELGTVQVEPGMGPPGASSASASAAATPGREPFAAIGGPRKSLGAWSAPQAPLLEGPRLWALIAAAPLLVGLLFGGQRLARHLRERRARGEASASALTARALREAREAEARGDARAVAAAVERAVHASVEAATGLRSRGVLLAELLPELEKHGVARDTAQRARDCLQACDALRFAPGASATDLGDLTKRARAVSEELARA